MLFFHAPVVLTFWIYVTKRRTLENLFQMVSNCVLGDDKRTNETVFWSHTAVLQPMYSGYNAKVFKMVELDWQGIQFKLEN